MTDTIPALPNYDEASLDEAFARLTSAVQNTDISDPEEFRLHWLGRKQGQLKLISEAWLKSAPQEAKRSLGIRFNQLKQQIEQALEAQAAGPQRSAAPGLDITLPGL